MLTVTMLGVEKLCVIFVSIICLANSGRILGIFHMPSYSHFQLGDRIFRELAVRGHEVTVISPYELKTPTKNLKHVVLTGFIEEMEEMKRNLFEQVHTGIITNIIWMSIFGVHFAEKVLAHPNVEKLLNSNEHFDLIIQENFMNEAFCGFSYHYQAPHVLISSVGNSLWVNQKMGNPSNPAYMPDLLLSYSSNMNLFQRTVNSLTYMLTETANHVYTYPMHNRLLQKYFPGSPHLSDFLYNTSLVLLNSHSSISNPVPLLPNMIEIGGYHIQPPKQLPKDLKEYLDNAKDGFVYFCLGSNLKSKNMDEDKRNQILKVLGNLKQKVLWKWEDDVLPGQPRNLKLGKWFPQQDILAHPNIKLFITHGGMLSTTEAIYHGVPVLGIPVFGDQELNIVSAEQAGYGIGVPYTQLNEASLSSALNEVLTNPKYMKNAKIRSTAMHDQIMKPMDRAMYWIEYVMRHKGAPHLKTAALQLSWYQRLLLDVVAVLIVGTIVVLWILSKIMKRLCFKRNKKSGDRAKKDN